MAPPNHPCPGLFGFRTAETPEFPATKDRLARCGRNVVTRAAVKIIIVKNDAVYIVLGGIPVLIFGMI